MRHSQHLTFQELELRRQELVQRRKLVEQKLQEQGKLFHELQQSQKESQIRLIQRYQEQNNQARKRNQSYLEEIALVSSTAQLQKDLVKIKHQSTSSSYNPRAPTSSASYLLQAKKNYESHFENLLPSYYREQTHQMEEEYKKLQLTKLQSKHRHERLKQELIREQEMKARLYQQKQELLQILTLEQKDLMESKIHHLLLQEENQLITQELQQYLANEGYRLEAQVKQELEQFQPEDVLSLPKATSSNNLIDKHVSQRGKLGSLLPPPPAVDRVANEMMSLPAQHLDQPLPISQKKNDSSSNLAELKRNALVAMREAQVQQMSADTMKRSLTRDSSILSQSNNTSQYNNLTVAGEEHLPPHQNTQPQFLPSQTSEAKSVVPATLSALSQENFFAISGSNTTSRNPSPSHKRGAPRAESLDDFPTITAVTADAKEVVIKASDSNVINTTADPSANTSGSDEFDVLSEKYSSANQASLPFPEQTSVAEPASAKSLNKTSSSKPTSMEKFEFSSEGGKKSESAIVTSNKSAKERKTDINTMGVDIVNKILNKCYQFVEGQLSSLTSLRHIYDWFDGIPTNPTLNLVQQLYDQIDKITSDFWEGEGISKTNNSLKIAGEVVLYIVAEKGSLLIPSHVVEGVVTMDKLRRELKKTNGLLLLWDNLINHLKIIVSVKPSWLEGVTSCFTSALVKHVSASSGDDENYERMKRKIHKLLQLGVIPEDVESPTNPNSAPSPYRRTSAAPTVFSVTDSNWAPTSTNMVVEAEEASALTFNIGKRKSIPSTAPVSSNPLALNNSVMAPILNKSEISRVAELELDEIEEDESFEKPPAIKDLDTEQRSMITPQASVSNAHRSKSVNVSSNTKMSRNNDVDEFDF